MSRRLRPLLYGLVALVLLFEGAVFALLFFPRVSDGYRAYYIERSTDCWPLSISGRYRLGTTVSFVAGQPSEAGNLKVCGWTDPADTGTWSVGGESRLRFHVPGPPGDLLLSLDMLGFVADARPSQRVVVSANGETLDTIALGSASTGQKLFRIPRRLVLSRWGWVDVTLSFPDAVSPAALGINRDTRDLAVRILSLRLWATAPRPDDAGDT